MPYKLDLFICSFCKKEFKRNAIRAPFCTKKCASAFYKKPPKVRFWQMVSKSTTCWNWTGSTYPHGHGMFNIHWGKSPIRAHRFSWEIHRGRIPSGMCVLHKCDVPACVNPEHLFIGTQLDNVRDMISKKRHAFGERNGHSKLKIRDILLIRKLWPSLPQYKLAKKFGIDQGHVSNIIRGKAWKTI